MNQNKKQKILNIFVIVIYSIITFIIMIKHEPWRDEAQAWMISKDLSFFGVIGQMRYEGHPCLWHMILFPFAKLNFPPITLNIIAWIIMVVAAILLIYKAPFNKITKIFILCSAPFIYFYVAISRVYTIIALLLIIIASLYNDKEKHPCIYAVVLALLANTHIVMCMTVCALILDYYIKTIYFDIKNKHKVNKNIITGLIISGLGVLIMLLQLYSSLGINKEINSVVTLDTILNHIIVYAQVLTQMFFGKTNIIYFLLTAIIFLIIPFIIIKDKMKYIIYYGTILYQFLIFVFIYGFTMQTMYNIYFLIILVFWLEYDRTKHKKVIDITLVIITLASLLYTVKDINKDIKHNYSSSKEIAEYICENIDKNDTIICTTDYSITPVSMYCSDYNFYSVQERKNITFVTWDDTRKKEVNIEDINNIIKNNNGNKYILYSINEDALMILAQLVKTYEIETIYVTNDAIRLDEVYYLLKIEE